MAAIGQGGHESVDACRMGEAESVGAGVCWQIVEHGLCSFPNACVWTRCRWGNYGSRMSYYGNILLTAETNGRQEGQRQ